MKTRNGFVSNSSSSSFVILLPENFDVEKHVEENWNKFDSYSIGDLLEDLDWGTPSGCNCGTPSGSIGHIRKKI